LRQIIKLADNTLDWDWIVRLAVDGRNVLSIGQALRCAEDLVDARIPIQILFFLHCLFFQSKAVLLICGDPCSTER